MRLVEEIEGRPAAPDVDDAALQEALHRFIVG
jgi:hypothetical protein